MGIGQLLCPWVGLQGGQQLLEAEGRLQLPIPSAAGSAPPVHPSTLNRFVSLSCLWVREVPDVLIWYAGSWGL